MVTHFRHSPGEPKTLTRPDPARVYRTCTKRISLESSLKELSFKTITKSMGVSMKELWTEMCVLNKWYQRPLCNLVNPVWVPMLGGRLSTINNPCDAIAGGGGGGGSLPGSLLIECPRSGNFKGLQDTLLMLWNFLQGSYYKEARWEWINMLQW